MAKSKSTAKPRPAATETTTVITDVPITTCPRCLHKAKPRTLRGPRHRGGRRVIDCQCRHCGRAFEYTCPEIREKGGSDGD